MEYKNQLRPRTGRATFAGAATLLMCATITAGGRAIAAEPPPLYGDPAHPNLSGMWEPELNFLPGAPPPAGAPTGAPRGPRGPSLTPAYAAKVAELTKRANEGNPVPDTVTECLAFGMPRFMGVMPVEIIQTPGQLTLNLGVLHDIRRIYMDGIGHTIGADPSFNGDSVGHWEGDTLVVDTNNMRAGFMGQNGLPYSDKITAVERFRRVGDKLDHVMILTDPEAFTAPYTVHTTYRAMPRGSRFEEYICENNRDK